MYDHLRVPHQPVQRITIGKVTPNPVHAIATRLAAAGKRIDRHPLLQRQIHQCLPDKAGGAGKRNARPSCCLHVPSLLKNRHSSTSWSRCTIAERGA